MSSVGLRKFSFTKFHDVFAAGLIWGVTFQSVLTTASAFRNLVPKNDLPFLQGKYETPVKIRPNLYFPSGACKTDE